MLTLLKILAIDVIFVIVGVTLTADDHPDRNFDATVIRFIARNLYLIVSAANQVSVAFYASTVNEIMTHVVINLAFAMFAIIGFRITSSKGPKYKLRSE